MIKKIVFATDFSPLSKQALLQTVELSRKTGAEIIGTYTLALPVAVHSFEPIPDEYKAHLEEASRLQLQAFFRSRQADGKKISTRMGIGVPEQAVNELASKERADLIVVARHSRTRLERFFVGSVTEKILRGARHPVLVVPENGNKPVPAQTILCGVDFSQASLKALRFAIDLASDCRASLQVLHVLELPGSETIASDLHAELSAAWTKNAADKLQHLVDTFGASSDTVTLVAEGKPAATILAKATELKAASLVVGKHGLGPIEWAGTGSTVSAIIRAAHLPVFVVPD